MMRSYTHKMALCDLHNDSLDPQNDLHALKMMLYDLKLLSGPLTLTLVSSQWPCMPPTMILCCPHHESVVVTVLYVPSQWQMHSWHFVHHSQWIFVSHTVISGAFTMTLTMSLMPLNVFVWPSHLFCIPSQWVCVPQKWLFIWLPQCHFVTFMMACVPTNDFVYIHSDSVCSLTMTLCGVISLCIPSMTLWLHNDIM